MALEDTDNLIVQRGTTLNKVQIQNMSTIQDNDLLVIGRQNESYKITGKEFLESIGPKGTVDKPSIIAPADNAGEMVAAESDEIITVDSRAKTLQKVEYHSPTGGPGILYGFEIDGKVLDASDEPNYAQTSVLNCNRGIKNPDRAFNGGLTNGAESTSTSTTTDYVYTWTPSKTWVVNDFTVWGYAHNPSNNNEAHAIAYWTDGTTTRYDDDGSKSGLFAFIVNEGGTTLTLAGDKDLTVFQPLDDVQQDSGHTPQTSAITNVAADTPAAGQTTLTFTDNKDLANFRVGDTFPGGIGLGISAHDLAGNPLTCALAADTILRAPKNSVYNITGFIETFKTESAGLLQLDSTTSIASCTYEIIELVNGTTSDALTGSIGTGLSKVFNINFTGAGQVRIKYTYQVSMIDGAHILHYANTPGRNTWNGVDMVFAGANQNVLVSINDNDTGPLNTITAIDVANNTMILDDGDYSVGQVLTGPDTEPAIGTIESIGPGNTMTLSVSDETYPKRWIVNQGKFVKGEETPSQDAAPDADGLTIQSSAFASTPVGSLGHTDSDWQITLKTDTAYANVVAESLADGTNLTTWEPGGLEAETEYRCRVKHRSNLIESEWSEDSTFKTATVGLPIADPGDVYTFSNGDTSLTPITTPAKVINISSGNNSTFAVGIDGKIYSGAVGATTLSENFFQSNRDDLIGLATTYQANFSGSGNWVYIHQDGSVTDLNLRPGLPDKKYVFAASFGTQSQVSYVIADDGEVWTLADSAGVSVAGVATSNASWTQLPLVLPGGRKPKEITRICPQNNHDNLMILANDQTLWHVTANPANALSGLPTDVTSLASPEQLIPGERFSHINSAGAGAVSAVNTNGDLYYAANGGQSNTGSTYSWQKVPGEEGLWKEPVFAGFSSASNQLVGLRADGYLYNSPGGGPISFQKIAGQTKSISSTGITRHSQQYNANSVVLIIPS